MEKKNWLWPVPYTTEHRPYTGSYADGGHSGLDISTSGIEGQNVYASKDGVVINTYEGCKNHNGLDTGIQCSPSIGCECNDIKSYGTGYFCNFTIGNAVYI